MPLRLDIKKKLVSRSDRVKCVDLHPDEPWVLSALYNGHMFIWNYETQAMVKSFEVAEQPLRCCCFVARKQWAISGADDMFVRVYNYNTMEKVKQFEAHMDYIRTIEVHPTLPYLLTASDDLQIKLWDWERGWMNTQVFEGHAHYVMQVKFNPKDTNTFASASLDRTIKVWSLGSPLPNYSLEGHEKGVNCIDYYTGGDKPYLLSGADDHTVKIWDYQTKSCVQTLEGHTNNVSSVCFHPKLPIILTGSEDGTVRVWHSTTYRLESTLNYGLERAWSIAVSSSSNKVAIGYDEGTIVLKLGQEMPVVCMDGMGNIIQAVNNDISASAIRNVPKTIGDGERIDVTSKDLGTCEIYPQKVAFNGNGTFVAVCGDGEYIIYTGKALRNKSFGSALDFGWAATGAGGDYAVREAQSKIKIFKNFKEDRSFKTAYSAEGLYGGHMIGVTGSDFVCFYDWDDDRVIRRIDVAPKNIYWSESGTHVVLACEDSYFVLSCDRQVIVDAITGNGKKVDPDEGVDGSFEYLDEVSEKVRSGQWVGDCFVYTNAAGRLNYYVGGEVITLCHLDRPMYLLGFLPKQNRVFLMDKTRNVTSFKLLESVLQYQTAIVRKDFETANEVLREVPPTEYNKIARFLEGQGFKEEALQVCTDPEQKFDLALQLQKFDIAVQLMDEIVKSQHLSAGETMSSDVQLKWKQLGDLALAKGNLQLARECAKHAQDFSGLLLMFTSAGDAKGLSSLATMARLAGRSNIAVLCHFLLGEIEHCLQILIEAGRYPEACFMARTYLPSMTPELLEKWKSDLAKSNSKAAEALASPVDHEDFFPYWKYALQAETLSKKNPKLRAAAYIQVAGDIEKNMIEEMKKLEESGTVVPVAAPSSLASLPELSNEVQAPVDSEINILEVAGVQASDPQAKPTPVVIEPIKPRDQPPENNFNIESQSKQFGDDDLNDEFGNDDQDDEIPPLQTEVPSVKQIVPEPMNQFVPETVKEVVPSPQIVPKESAVSTTTIPPSSDLSEEEPWGSESVSLALPETVTKAQEFETSSSPAPAPAQTTTKIDLNEEAPWDEEELDTGFGGSSSNQPPVIQAQAPKVDFNTDEFDDNAGFDDALNEAIGETEIYDDAAGNDANNTGASPAGGKKDEFEFDDEWS